MPPMTDWSLAQMATTLPPAGAPPGRLWLEGAGWIVPAAWATRALLIPDVAVLLVAAVGFRHPVLAVPVALGTGFLVLNALAMILTDFFVGLLFFHLAVGTTGVLAGGLARWAGAGLLALTLALGLVT